MTMGISQGREMTKQYELVELESNIFSVFAAIQTAILSYSRENRALSQMDCGYSFFNIKVAMLNISPLI